MGHLQGAVDLGVFQAGTGFFWVVAPCSSSTGARAVLARTQTGADPNGLAPAIRVHQRTRRLQVVFPGSFGLVEQFFNLEDGPARGNVPLNAIALAVPQNGGADG